MGAVLDLSQITFKLNDVEVVGWSDDSDALLFPQEQTRYASKWGATGFRTASSSGERFGGSVTIKLSPTSPTTKLLVSNMQQEDSGGFPIKYEGFYRNNVTGETSEMQDGTLVIGPKGPSMGSGDFANAVFVFDFTRIIRDVSAANFGT